MMNQFFILNYIKKLTKNDIEIFAQKQNITLSKEEIEIIYYYIKNKYQDFFNGKEQELLLELKTKLSKNTYEKILEYYHLYLQNKQK